MPSESNNEKYKTQIAELEKQLSEQKFELEDARALLKEEQRQRQFYQSIADFTFGWELWFDPNGVIKYCSPSCFDLTGYTANQIVKCDGIDQLLVYEPDRTKYSEFLLRSLDHLVVNQLLDFRILTRTKQLRWCMMNVRGVYDKLGKYLGVRASIQDITRLKRAMGHIQEMEASREIENRAKQRLHSELSSKDRELVSFLLQLSQKNELLTKISNQLKMLVPDRPEKDSKDLMQLLELVESKSDLLLDWGMIENQIERIHPGFMNRLQSKHPVISAKDKKLSAYLRLGLSNKEISGLLNITPKSVEIARVRLRKKLKLTPKIRLANYLSQL